MDNNILLKSTVALLVILIIITIYNTYKLHNLDEEPIENMQPPVPMNMGNFYTPVTNMPMRMQPRVAHPPQRMQPQSRNIMHKETPMRNNMPMNNNMPHYKEMPNNSNIQLNTPQHNDIQMFNDVPKEMINIPGLSMDPEEAYKRFNR